MIQLDERLSAIAELASEAIAGKESPCAADIGCDHGRLTAHLLERYPELFMIAGDVSEPSLQKARTLLAAHGLAERAKTVVSDGLAGIDRPVHAIVIAGMGAEMILKIVREGRGKIGGAALIVQANVDLPMLRGELAQMGFCAEREVYTRAAGRRYVTMLVREGAAKQLDERKMLLGTAADGVRDAFARDYYLWQRSVRVREMERVARLESGHAAARMEKNSREVAWMSEALNANRCTVAEMERLVSGIAPVELAEEWDNVGLLLGHAGHVVTRALVALDLTDGVIHEAKALGAQLIVTHHPIMFSARKRVTDGDREGRLMLSMIENGMAHIAAHTNFDSAPGGVNDTLMALMGAEHVRGEGCIRIGDLAPGTTLAQVAERARKKLHADVRVYGAADTAVTTLGCCSGAGSSELYEARVLGADCFITGEVKHDRALDAMDMGLSVVEAGHFETENPACEVLASALQNACDALKYNVTVFCSKENPFGR